MAIGDKKNLYLSKGYSEKEYERKAADVSFKRSVNKLQDAILLGSGFDPIAYLKQMELAALSSAPQDQDEYLEWLINDCLSPIPIMREYLFRIAINEYLITKDGFIAEHIRKFPKDSFRRFGDVNRIESNFTRNWIDDSGIELDVQAAYLSEDFGKEISIEDLIDFVYMYPNGSKQFKSQLPEFRLDEAFKKLTGTTINPKYARAVLKQLELETQSIIENAPF